jgi:formyl-CoA transferase
LQEIRMDDGDMLTLPGIVPKLSATPGGHRRNAPALGQDTDDVLRELGLTPGQIEGLKQRGIVAASKVRTP